MTTPIPGIDLEFVEGLRDSISRRTPPNDVETHRLLAEIDKIIKVASKLEEDRQKAWGEADHAAWREAANAAYQSMIMMNGVTAHEDNGRMFATDGEMDTMTEEECAARSTKRLNALAKLADEAGVAMLRRDRARREASR
jgi:hypothetical protein